MAKVVITISRSGKVKREAFGFKGEDCIKKTSFLDAFLGQPKKELLKEEYYEQEVNSDILPSGWCG